MNDDAWISILAVAILVAFFVGLLGGGCVGMHWGYKDGQIDYQRDIVKYEIRADGTIWELKQNVGGEK